MWRFACSQRISWSEASVPMVLTEAKTVIQCPASGILLCDLEVCGVGSVVGAPFQDALAHEGAEALTSVVGGDLYCGESQPFLCPAGGDCGAGDRSEVAVAVEVCETKCAVDLGHQ